MTETRTIFHIDVNSAFLSWEAVYRINFLGEERDLRNMVSAIGGDVENVMGLFWQNLSLLKNIISEQVKVSLKQDRSVHIFLLCLRIMTCMNPVLKHSWEF